MDKATLQRLYLDEKLSARQIANRLGESESKVVYWIDKHKIPKRSLSDAIYHRHNGATDPFNIKTDLSPEEEKLKAFALALWITEGSPKRYDQVYTSNSNPDIIGLFVGFLEKVCRVEKSKIRLRILYYPNMDMKVDEVIEFWQQVTGLERNQIAYDLYKPEHNYRTKSKYGTATVTVSNIKLQKQMAKWLQELYDEID